MDHIKELRLFDLSRADAREGSIQPDKRELQHLHDCEECQRILEVFARQFNSAAVTPAQQAK